MHATHPPHPGLAVSVFFTEQGSLGLGGQVSVSGFSCLGSRYICLLQGCQIPKQVRDRDRDRIGIQNSSGSGFKTIRDRAGSRSGSGLTNPELFLEFGIGMNKIRIFRKKSFFQYKKCFAILCIGVLGKKKTDFSFSNFFLHQKVPAAPK